MNVRSTDGAAYKKRSKRCYEYDPRHHSPTLLAAEFCPADAPYESEDYANQDAYPELVITVLNEIESETRSSVDIKRSASRRDQKRSSTR